MKIRNIFCLVTTVSLLFVFSCSNNKNPSSNEVSQNSSIDNNTSSSFSDSVLSEDFSSVMSSINSEISSEVSSSEESSGINSDSNENSSEESLDTSISSEEVSSSESLESISSEESSSEHVHYYNEGWIVDKEANEFEKGEKHRTCSECGATEEEVIPYTLDFPRVYIDYQKLYPNAPDATDYSGFANWTWDYLTVPIKYEGSSTNTNSDFDCYAQMKIQGGTSKNASYLKKNYTIKLYEDRDCTKKNNVKMVDSWGKQNKYVLKSNWIDITSSRNLVTAGLWSDVVESRSTSQYVSPRDNLDVMVNNGAVDGFPVMLYFNGKYFGLYTFNIPKDNWLFGMKKSNTQALLFAEGTAKKADGSLYQSTGFKELIEWDNASMAGSGWELEYAYDESDTKWIADSMNKAIQLVMDTYGKLKDSMSSSEKKALRDKFISEAPNYLDVDGCIDYMIFLHCIQGFPDNSTKNVIWSTYDGKVWSPNAYDLDTTWCLSYDGQVGVFENRIIDHTSGGFWGTDWYRANLRGNALFEAILLFYAEQVQNRYNELRNGPLSYDHISESFATFINGIPQVLYDREASDYPTRPSEQVSPVTGNKNTTDLNQIINFASSLLSFMDGEYNGDKMTHNINYFNQ